MNLLDRAAKAPVRLIVLLAVGVVAITAVVATQRHRVADAAEATAAAVPPAVASTAAADIGHERRSAPVSRSADRTDRRDHAHRADRPQRVRHATRLTRKPPKPAKPRLPAAPLDAEQMVAAAKSSSTNVPGQCLSWSREQADIPSRYGDAAGAWDHAAGRHPGDTTPPKGAAVYWTGGSVGHGHVAISLGHGLVRSTDAGGSGVVATVPLSRLTRDWNLDYAGWASSINGYAIRGIAGT